MILKCSVFLSPSTPSDSGDKNTGAEYHARGLERGAAKDFQGAVLEYTKALECDPTLMKSCFNRGLMLARLNNPRDAIRDFTTVIEDNPCDYEAYYHRGRLRSLLNEKDGALADLDMAIDNQFRVGESLRERGLVYFNFQDFREALSDLLASYHLTKNESLNDAIAYAFSQIGEEERAIGFLCRATEFNAFNVGTYLHRSNLATSLAAAGALMQAVDSIPHLNSKRQNAKALQFSFDDMVADGSAEHSDHNQENEIAYYNSGNSLYSQSNYYEAIQAYSSCLEINPKNAWAYNNRGNAKFHLRESPGALSDYDQCLNLLSEHYGPFFNRALVYELQGKSEPAFHDFNEVIVRNDSFSPAYFKMGLLLFHMMSQYDHFLADQIANKRMDEETICEHRDTLNAHYANAWYCWEKATELKDESLLRLREEQKEMKKKFR